MRNHCANICSDIHTKENYQFIHFPFVISVFIFQPFTSSLFFLSGMEPRIAFNDPPDVIGEDAAIMRRMRVIPFGVEKYFSIKEGAIGESDPETVMSYLFHFAARNVTHVDFPAGLSKVCDHILTDGSLLH